MDMIKESATVVSIQAWGSVGQVGGKEKIVTDTVHLLTSVWKKHWLWWGLHISMNMLKTTELDTLNGWIIWYVNYTRIILLKQKRKKEMLSQYQIKSTPSPNGFGILFCKLLFGASVPWLLTAYPWSSFRSVYSDSRPCNWVLTKSV